MTGNCINIITSLMPILPPPGLQRVDRKPQRNWIIFLCKYLNFISPEPFTALVLQAGERRNTSSARCNEILQIFFSGGIFYFQGSSAGAQPEQSLI